MKLHRGLPVAERRRLAQSCLRLFVSVDLEGSTSFKQRLANRQSRTWLSVVLDFVEGFNVEYWKNIGRVARDIAKTTSPKQPGLWKILGDELVFVMEIRRPVDAAIYIDALKDTLADWNREVLTQRKTASVSPERPLLVKGAAWLAEFPVTNTVLPIAGSHHDYIGPSMDTGFRIAKLASPRRLALAVELAWLLLKHDATRCIEFAGRNRELKGVAADSGYPQLWIEVPASEYHRREHEVLKKRRADINGAELCDLCASFITDFGVPPDLPHLPNNADFPQPAGYEEALAAARDDLETRYLPQTDPEKTKPAKKSIKVPAAELLAGLDSVVQDARRQSPPAPSAKPGHSG